jgi:hypothetical protein
MLTYVYNRRGLPDDRSLSWMGQHFGLCWLGCSTIADGPVRSGDTLMSLSAQMLACGRRCEPRDAAACFRMSLQQHTIVEQDPARRSAPSARNITRAVSEKVSVELVMSIETLHRDMDTDSIDGLQGRCVSH